MADETESKASLQPFLSAHDQNDDLAGASVLTLLQRSAYMAEGNSQYAADIAKDLSRRLVASQARVAELRVGLLSWRSSFKSIEIDLNRRNSGSTRSPLSSRDGSRQSHGENPFRPCFHPYTEPCPILTPRLRSIRRHMTPW
jgi:hypothetical protein